MMAPALLEDTGSVPAVARPRPAPAGRIAATTAVIAVVAAAEIAVTVIGHGGYAAVLFGILLFTGAGTAIATAIVGELRRDAWFRRNGVPVTAALHHRTRRRKVYVYTDVTGEPHRYPAAGGGERKSLLYDPADPARAVERVTLGERCVVAAGGVFAALLACGGLFAVVRLFGQALGE